MCFFSDMDIFLRDAIYILCLYVYIYIYLSIWVNYNDLTETSLESRLVREIIPFYGLKIQVSEIL